MTGDRPLLGWPGWIGVVVDDLDGQGRFWGDLLGLPESARGEDFIQFDLPDGRTFEVLLRSDDPQYDRRRFQVGFVVDDIEAARVDLIRRGVEPITDILGAEEARWAYFRDPEGNVFEITERSRDDRS
jgi:catechol 2,3-dioxygenase-like lactoylglutathione lyase family enzyme